MNRGELYYMTVIAERNIKEELIRSLSETGLKLIGTTYGHGIARVNELMHAFGFVVENRKVIITGLVKGNQRDDLFRMLQKDFGFDKPNTGIAYTIEVEKLSF